MGRKTDIRNKHLHGVLWNWKPVADALPGKCGVSDLDGIIERRGRFLVVETKNPGELVPLGQLIMLRALAKQPSFTVLVATGDAETGAVSHYSVVTPDGLTATRPGEALVGRIRAWFRWASTHPQEK